MQIKNNKKKNNGKAKKRTVKPAANTQPSRGRQGLLSMADMAGSLVPFGLGNVATQGLRGLANHAANWLGLGAYKLRSNNLITKPIPSMHSNSQSTIVRHREYVCDIYSPAVANAFGIAQTLVLNPGLPTSFPWLSSIAGSYTEYTWRGLVVEFVSTSAEWSGAGQSLGSVSIATQYNVNAAPFQNKQVMLNEYFANDSKPSQDFIHPIECDPKENPFKVQYIRQGPVPSGQDPKMFDIGTTTVAVQGVSSTSVPIGELWVSYEVELRKPVPALLLDNGSGFAHYTLLGGFANATPLGGAPVLVVDTIGLSIIGNVITFPSLTTGTYQVTYSCGNGAAVSIVEPTITLANCSYVTFDSITNVGAVGTAVTTYIKYFLITITSGNPGVLASITFGGGATLPNGVSHVELFVDEVPYHTSV